MYEIGPQCDGDDRFKAAARRHQSRYRANILNVGYSEYGNWLTDEDAQSLMNYYEGLNTREELRKRYLSYWESRDANMLRSEHIPFNMLAPLKEDSDLAKHIVEGAFGIECQPPFDIRFEWAPDPKEDYLGDKTAFDTYIQYHDRNGRTAGIGIEVKYTEHGYRIGASEAARVADKGSRYWEVTRVSGQFLNQDNELLGHDDMRQIWRNHLLGLAMCQRGEISEFTSIILYPEGNEHFGVVIPKYQHLLKEAYRGQVRGCTFEKYIESITGGEEILKWKGYLSERYLVG